MKIIISAILLKKFFRYVNKIASYDKNCNLLFLVKDNKLIIQVNSKRLSISATFDQNSYDFEVIEEGKILVNANLINELVQRFYEEKLHLIVLENNVLQIVTNSSKTSINLTEIDQWEEIDFNIEGPSVELPTSVFHDISNELAFATANKEGKPIFQGVNISNKNSYLVASTTDTLRLVWKQLIPFTEKIDLILPINTVYEINRLNDIGCETTKIIYNKNQISINLDDKIKLLSPLIDGQYPDLTKQLNRNFTTEIVCLTETLIKVIERCSVFREETEPWASVCLVVKDDFFEVSSAFTSKGHHKQKITTSHINGENQKIKFQSRFLLEALRSFPTKTQVRIKFSEKEGPILLRIVENDQIFNLILPVWD